MRINTSFLLLLPTSPRGSGLGGRRVGRQCVNLIGHLQVKMCQLPTHYFTCQLDRDTALLRHVQVGVVVQVLSRMLDVHAERQR